MRQTHEADTGAAPPGSCGCGRALRAHPGRARRPFFCSAPKMRAAAIRLLSALARLDISSPREQGVRLVFGMG